MRTTIRKLIILLVLTAGAAHSAEWEVEPALKLKAGYNDNIRLNIDDEISSAEATLSPSAVFRMSTPESGVSGRVRFDFRRFEEDSNLDDNNTRFNLSSFRRMERSQIGLNAALTKDTTLDTQLEDTGLAFERLRRVQLNGGPNWSYSIDERTEVTLNYNYSDVQYKNAGGTGFVDFTVHSGQTSLQRVLDERAMASITLSYSQTDNENDVKSKNINLQGGGFYRFSETLSASLFAGVRRTESDFSQNSLIPIFAGDTIIGFVPLAQNVSNSSTGYTFNGSLNKSFLRGKSDITASRNISTSTNGAPVEVTRMGWDSEYLLSEILTASLSLQFYNSKTSNAAITSVDRDYYQISPRVKWNFKKYWSISGRYQYSVQTFSDTSDEATQNAAYLTLGYRWPRIAVSR